MKDLFFKSRKPIIIAFILLTLGGAFFATQLKFTFSFEQFFPEGDDDLAFFQEFISDFETDDNFLLIAIENKEGVFDSSFLKRFHEFSIECKGLPHVTSSQSLTQIKYPLKTPFGITTIPAIHINDPSKYEQDKKIIFEDERLYETLINSDGTAAIVSLKNIESIGLEESEELVNAVYAKLDPYDFDDYHLLGRAYFSKELVEMQLFEIILTSLISGILILIVMFLIYKKPITVFLGLISIGMGLIIFLGVLGLLGRELNIMSALYPVLMLIVGTSDVIHIMTKYLDELKKGKVQNDAIWVTIKEVGLATLLTSLTTAVGFLTLMSSRIYPIRDFGVNAGIGVIIAYIVVILFTTACLSLCKKEQLLNLEKEKGHWNRLMEKGYQLTIQKSKMILAVTFIITIACIYGMTLISTNYKIESNLPRSGKVTEDFKYFEKNFGGFRPLEFAIQTKGELLADNYLVQTEINKLENQIRSTGKFNSIVSPTMMQKSIERMNGRNKASAYTFPETKKRYLKNQRLIEKIPSVGTNILLNKDKTKARLSTRLLDIGADNIRNLGLEMDDWIDKNIDTSMMSVKRTGSGILVDKNAFYVRESLMKGLSIALVIISLLMGFLFRDFKMLLISMIPNVFPLLFAAGLMGFLAIEMEAGVAIVFAIIFGIAVDDTIHFLSKFKLSLHAGKSVEESIHVTFRETGKAICLTSVILFFGFMIMLFSNNPPSVNIGLLISITLVSAVACDLFLLPILIRRFIKKD